MSVKEPLSRCGNIFSNQVYVIFIFLSLFLRGRLRLNIYISTRSLRVFIFRSSELVILVETIIFVCKDERKLQVRLILPKLKSKYFKITSFICLEVFWSILSAIPLSVFNLNNWIFSNFSKKSWKDGISTRSHNVNKCVNSH